LAESLTDRLRNMLEDMSTDPVEEVVVDYIVRELNNGRRLNDIVNDPYVRNRFGDERIAKIIEDPTIGEAVDQAVKDSFANKDFGFGD
jgi:hypothetical protein